MNVDELVTQLRQQREELTEDLTELRAMRRSASDRIKAQTIELARVNRLIRAAEGRKGKVDGSP